MKSRIPKTPKTPASKTPVPTPTPAPAPTLPSQPWFEFDFYLSFATIRNCYGAWLAKDRTVYIPLVITPTKKRIIEGLLTGAPSAETTPFLTLLDAWKALGIEVNAMRLETHKTAPMVRGLLQLKQVSELGTNLAEIGCEHSDLMVLSLLLNRPVTVNKANAEVLCAHPKDVNADDVGMSDGIQRAMLILEDATELDALTKQG